MLQQTFPLGALESQPHGLLMGRLETCQIRFPPDARMIGREHACLVVRPDGVFLVGLHQNGTFVDGAVLGQGGQIELHYGARIQLGKGGPILVLRELPDVTHPPRPMQPYGSRTIIEHHPETAQDLQAEIEALKMASQELDRQNQQLRAEKESLQKQVQTLERRLSAGPPPLPAPMVASPSQTTPRTREETEATLQRFSQGLLQLQKLTRTDPANLTKLQSELQNRLEQLIFDLDDLHRMVSSR